MKDFMENNLEILWIAQLGSVKILWCFYSEFAMKELVLWTSTGFMSDECKVSLQDRLIYHGSWANDESITLKISDKKGNQYISSNSLNYNIEKCINLKGTVHQTDKELARHNTSANIKVNNTSNNVGGYVFPQNNHCDTFINNFNIINNNGDDNMNNTRNINHTRESSTSIDKRKNHPKMAKSIASIFTGNCKGNGEQGSNASETKFINSNGNGFGMTNNASTNNVGSVLEFRRDSKTAKRLRPENNFFSLISKCCPTSKLETQTSHFEDGGSHKEQRSVCKNNDTITSEKSTRPV